MTDGPFDYAYYLASQNTLLTLETGVEYALVRNRDNSDAGYSECFFRDADEAALYAARLQAAWNDGGLGRPREHREQQTKGTHFVGYRRRPR